MSKLVLAALLSFAMTSAFAQTVNNGDETNMMDELNPFDPNIEQKLQIMDQMYFEQTGEMPFLIDDTFGSTVAAPDCKRETCKVWAKISLDEQKLYLYQDGVLTDVWLVSSGSAGHGTPAMELHPNGRVYDKYTSTKFPEGDYNGLGNMPYAVFLKGGFAIHGTTKGNFKRLGTKASHGCIRVHPDNGFTFNRLVRQHGIKNVWVSVY